MSNSFLNGTCMPAVYTHSHSLSEPMMPYEPCSKYIQPLSFQLWVYPVLFTILTFFLLKRLQKSYQNSWQSKAIRKRWVMIPNNFAVFAESRLQYLFDCHPFSRLLNYPPDTTATKSGGETTLLRSQVPLLHKK